MSATRALRGLLALAVLALTLVVGASTAAAAPAPARSGADAPAAGNVQVRFVMKKFVRQGKKLVAQGEAIATYTPVTGAPTTVTKPFNATVVTGGRSFAALQRTCSVLSLVVGPLDLNLLGLMVHLDKVTLNITAQSNGGVLGSLFCSLSRAKLRGLALKKAAGRLTQAARSSGLASSGVGFQVPVGAKTATQQQATTCSILNLTLGPLHLNLLGLVVDLSTVHLVITADPAGGLLGSLLCSLAQPPPVVPGT
jgi:hypothetical protein